MPCFYNKNNKRNKMKKQNTPKRKSVLVVSMLNDQTTNPENPKAIPNADKSLEKLQRSLVAGHIKHDAIIAVDYSGSKNSKWSDGKLFPSNKVIKVELQSDNWFGKENLMVVPESKGSGNIAQHFNNIDFLLPTSEYDLTFAGIDFFGTMSASMKELSKRGYRIRYYSDCSHFYGRNKKEELAELGIYRHFTTFKKGEK